MHTILVAGAGKSSTFLIDYLLSLAFKARWKVIVADGDGAAIAAKIKNHPCAEPAIIDITAQRERQALVRRADIVVSLMPPHLHIHLAKDCLQLKKNLITASYISPEIREMDTEVKAAGLMFMCEMGLDPGIDHMTANDIIFSIRRLNGKIHTFKSYCGGLIAPESDDNPWHYKFTWNPQNIVHAGKDGAMYLHNGKHVQVPYETVFCSTESVQVAGAGLLAGYPNRDSLSYLGLYETPEISTFLRATLRHPDFCEGWQALIDLGLTDDNDHIAELHTYATWLKEKSGYTGTVSLKAHIATRLNCKDNKIPDMLAWLGIMEEKPIPESAGKSSADALFMRLSDKWQMQEDDRDMVVMHHEIAYEKKGVSALCTSSMVLKGENKERSAMAKTVGLPMGILAGMALTGKIPLPQGVHIPNMPSIYRPVLKELERQGVCFMERIR